jgi:hypothetical protein
MAEVYTISGSQFGAPTVVGTTYGRAGNVYHWSDGSSSTSPTAPGPALSISSPAAVSYGAPTKGFPPAVLLQNALQALGVARGDAALSKLKVDGIIGPNTVKAVNYAISQTGGSPQFPHSNLTLQQVRSNAGALAAYVAQQVQKAGGTISTPVVVKRSSGSTSLIPAFAPPAGPVSVATIGSNKWVWYVVGGVSLLLVLSIVARSVRRPAPQPVKA